MEEVNGAVTYAFSPGRFDQCRLLRRFPARDRCSAKDHRLAELLCVRHLSTLMPYRNSVDDSASPLSPQVHPDPYVERVLSLFATRMPATIMSLLFVAMATLAAGRTADPLVIVLLCAGTIVSAARLELLFRGRSTHTVVTTTCDAARRLERRYAWWYLAFAVIFGCFAARTTFLPDPALRTPVAILVVGYAAGAVETAALRPAIAVPSVIMAVMPTAAVLASGGDGPDAVSCVCLLALLAGGLRSLSRRHDAQGRQLRPVSPSRPWHDVII